MNKWREDVGHVGLNLHDGRVSLPRFTFLWRYPDLCKFRCRFELFDRSCIKCWCTPSGCACPLSFMDHGFKFERAQNKKMAKQPTQLRAKHATTCSPTNPAHAPLVDVQFLGRYDVSGSCRFEMRVTQFSQRYRTSLVPTKSLATLNMFLWLKILCCKRAAPHKGLTEWLTGWLMTGWLVD